MLRRIAPIAALAAVLAAVAFAWPRDRAEHGVALGDPDFVTAAASGETPFSGQVTEKGCDSTNTFAADPSSTINVSVSAQVPTNDIMVNLIYGGRVVHNEDTGVGQETFAYSVDENKGGKYTVQVCKSGNPATPFLPDGGPYPFSGLWSDADVAAPVGVTPPPTTKLPTTVRPLASYTTWKARFAPATVVDAQRTEGEPLQVVDPDGAIWESGPFGFTTAQSWVHRSTNDGREYHLVSGTQLRPDAPPGGGDTDLAVDDQGNLYFADLEGLAEIGTSVSRDNGMTWSKNPAAVEQTAVDRQWYAVDNGTSASASDNSIFIGFHETGLGTFIYSSPGSLGPTDAVGGLIWQNSASLPGPLQPLASDAVCAKLHFDPVKRNLYMACNEGNHVRMTVGHVAVGQRTGIAYANYALPATPGGGSVMSLFPSCTTDAAGNVYVTWIDGTNRAVYYAFSTDGGQRWSTPVQVSHGDAVTNEFDWAQAGASGRLAVAWIGTAKTAKGGSDGMPSALADEGAATAYPWYGYTSLVTAAASKSPIVAQTRFTEKPMHFGNICNSGLGCTTDPTADRQMADFFGFSATTAGALRIVYDDTTNEFDGAGLYATRQLSGPTIYSSVSGSSPSGPTVYDATGDAQFPHYSTAGVGPNLKQLDLTKLAVSQSGSMLHFKLTVANLANMLVPPAGKASSLYLVRFQALGPLASEPQSVYHVYYAYMEATAGVVPQYEAGVAACQGTTPTNCKFLQYRGDKAAGGSISGNTITINVGLNGGFGVPVVGKKLYSVTAFTFGRNDSVDDLYADVDATQPFDFTVS